MSDPQGGPGESTGTVCSSRELHPVLLEVLVPSAGVAGSDTGAEQGISADAAAAGTQLLCVVTWGEVPCAPPRAPGSIPSTPALASGSSQWLGCVLVQENCHKPGIFQDFWNYSPLPPASDGS